MPVTPYSFTSSRRGADCTVSRAALDGDFQLGETTDTVRRDMCREYLDGSSKCQVNGEHLWVEDLRTEYAAFTLPPGAHAVDDSGLTAAGIAADESRLEMGDGVKRRLVGMLARAAAGKMAGVPEDVLRRFCEAVADQLTRGGALGRAPSAVWSLMPRGAGCFLLGNPIRDEVNVIPAPDGFIVHQYLAYDRLYEKEDDDGVCFKDDFALQMDFRFAIELRRTATGGAPTKGEKVEPFGQGKYRIEGIPLSLDLDTPSAKLQKVMADSSFSIWELILNAFAALFNMNRFDVCVPSRAESQSLIGSRPADEPKGYPSRNAETISVIEPDLKDEERKLRIGYSSKTVRGSHEFDMLQTSR